MPRTGIKTYRDLVVWDKAMDLAVAVYRFCDVLPPRRFDYMRFVSIANGSLCELQTHLLLVRRIERRWESTVDGILPSGMLTKLRRALKNSPARP